MRQFFRVPQHNASYPDLAQEKPGPDLIDYSCQDSHIISIMGMYQGPFIPNASFHLGS